MEMSKRKRFTRYGLIYLAWLFLLATLTQIWTVGPAFWQISWSAWDGQWYERIWREGYPHADPRALVFPPGYSILVGIFSIFTAGNFHLAALVFNLIAFFAFALIAAETLGREAVVPRLPIFLFILTAPSAYFMLASYSDSVFCLMLWATLYLALFKSSRRARAAEFALLLAMPWIRLTGYALASLLLLKRWTAAAVFVTLVAWLGLNQWLGGSPFYFLDAQKLFSMPEGNIFAGIKYTLGGVFPFPATGDLKVLTPYLQFHLLPSLYFLSLAAVGGWYLRRRQYVLGLTLLSILVVSHNQSFWRSAIRYNLPLFGFLAVPFLVAASRSCGKWWDFAWGAALGALALLQLLLQIWFANLFHFGQWAF